MRMDIDCGVIHTGARPALQSDDWHETSVTITDSLVPPAPTNMTLNMSNIREAAAAYVLVAREHGDCMRKKRAEVLKIARPSFRGSR